MRKDRKPPRKPNAAAPPAATRQAAVANSRRRLAILFGMLAVLIVFAVIRWQRAGKVEPDSVDLLPPPKDPRVAFATPFLNVRPTVRYVGDEACAGCHKA